MIKSQFEKIEVIRKIKKIQIELRTDLLVVGWDNKKYK